MRAADLAITFPIVTLTTSAIDAARLLADRDLPGLIVVGDDGRPRAVVPATQVLCLAVPRYILDDPAVAAVVDEAAADVIIRGLDGRTIADCLPQQPVQPPVVPGDATVLELSALMARTRSPLVAVVDGDGLVAGVVTLHGLLDRIVGEAA